MLEHAECQAQDEDEKTRRELREAKELAAKLAHEAGPRDVVTVLNHANQGNITWDETGKIHGNLPLELSVTLGYTPASVLSTQLGELQHTVLAPGKVSVKLPTFHWADMVVFKRS